MDEKNHYDQKYKNETLKKEDIDFKKLYNEWKFVAYPERKIFLNELIKENLKNKTILLLGNGISTKELYLLSLGATLIYSDISIEAVKTIQNRYNFKEYKDKIIFETIDGYKLPFKEQTIDIIIGYAFVHHLDDLDLFFSEVYRVLKQNGSCLFMDDAYSHVWNKFKFSFPIGYFYRRRYERDKISPEDIRASIKGGFSRKELEHLMKKHGFSSMKFKRFCFLTYFYRRFAGRKGLFCFNSQIPSISSKITSILNDIDNFLQKRSKVYSNNTIRLVWGFKKTKSCT